MMGHTHALSGAAAWLAATPLLGDSALLGHFAVHLSPAQIAAGTVVCAGAAMLPDIDHHDGTIANAFGPLTRVLCRIVGALSGGHRHATHSLVFAALAGLGASLAVMHLPGWAWSIVLFSLIGLGLHGIGIRVPERERFSALLNAVIAAALAYVMRDLDMGFAGCAVALGCLAHVLGDCLTPDGCPLFWPARWRIEVPLIPRTDGALERWVLAPLLTLGVVILAVRSALGVEATHWLRS
ncbi:MAG TPA: metal-dependent hydrolase [Streptosporangiaceae bacterium]|nr:metal-dependent hydrolase [Streptosporangiaceae bacterium]